jgi:hypothetical protein
VVVVVEVASGFLDSRVEVQVGYTMEVEYTMEGWLRELVGALVEERVRYVGL